MRSFKLIILVFITLVHFTANGQSAVAPQKFQDQPNLPKAFMIGEYEQPYENLINTYNKLLLNVCNNDLNKAYDIWSTILLDLEEYSKEMDFDLNGLKLWLYFFINADGSIQHIVYFPKANSRNTNYELVTSFFASFCKNYKLKVEITEKCSHYASASFPTFIKK